MRKIIVTEFVSLDGIINAPQEWTFQFWNEEIAKYKLDELFNSGALLLGRITYDGFAASWPSRKDQEGFADRMNYLPKYVASTTLQKADWNNSTILQGDVAEEIKKLKEQNDQDILVYGSGTLIQLLMQHSLVDQYRIMIFPYIYAGEGTTLSKKAHQTKLRLDEMKGFSSGVAALHYTPVQ